MRVIQDIAIDRNQWRQLVAESTTGTWFQSPEAYDLYASMPDVMHPYAFALEDGDRLQAICVVYVTKDSNAFKQFFTRRAIIVGGICVCKNIPNDGLSILLSAIRTQLSAQTIYIETRNFHDYSAWKGVFEACGFAYQPHLNFHFDCSDKETLYARLSETRRRQIKKAEKVGVEICEATSEEEVIAWYAILADLYRRKVKTPLFPLAFFIAFYRQQRGVYLLVKAEGKVIGGMMCPILDKRCIYEWFVCGMDAEYKAYSPSVMATWAAMEYAYAHGIKRFDIMGAGVPDVPYGVRDFKAEFGGELVEHGRFLHIAKPVLYRLGAIGVKLLKYLGRIC